MKTFNKLSFSFNGIQNGQKSNIVNAEPQLIVNSTSGKFTITSPVSKALGILPGQYVMFVNNIEQVESLVMNPTDEFAAWATEKGYDLTTREGQDAVVDELTQWCIAKGIEKFDSKGLPIMVSERFTKEDKAKYLEMHRMELVEANREALVDAFGDLTDEELAEHLTPDMVESPKVQDVQGSKTSTSSNATGLGLPLGFTDSNVWNVMKKDLGEMASKKNRIFDVDLTNPIKFEFNNGYKNVECTAYPISFKEDTNPMVRVPRNAKDKA